MKRTLSEMQIQYLKERRFEIIQGAPPIGEQYPYVSLREPQRIIADTSLTYHETKRLVVGRIGKAHPSNAAKDDLVDAIEYIVGNEMRLDGQLFTTQPGRKIKVFVADPAWNDVGLALAERYK